MATVANQVQKIYIGLLGRAADAEGLAYWTDEIESGALTLEQLRANIVEEQPEYLEGMGQMTRAQVVNQLYQNLFNRSAESEGLDYWVNGGGADINVDQLVLALIDGAQAADTLALDNKAEVAQYYTDAAGENYSESAARAAIADVDGGSNLAAAKSAVDARVEAGGDSLTLTQRSDNLQGQDGVDTTFNAPVTQDETGSGAVANTFETGDVLIGGANSTNTLNADLTASLSGAVPIAPTISATTENIQVVNLRAQFPNLADTTIDAEKMSGVEQWWSENSRSGILIEDIRSNPADTAFGMRDTDPGVSFASYINANYLEAGTEVGASAFNFTIQEANALGNELNDITVNGIRFQLDGESYELGGADVEAANDWAELQTALQANIDATEGLEGLTVEHTGNGQFVVTDPEAGDFVIDPAGTVISSSTTNEVKEASLGTPDITDLPTETAIVLDGAGNGSQGGAMDVGVMSGSRGVEVFNVNVVSNSHLATQGTGATAALMSSNLRTGEQYLEEVYVEGEGSLSLGSSTKVQGGVNAGVSTTTDDRLMNDGLVDVRVFDASGFEQELKVGAALTGSVFDRYLEGAEDTVQFSYLLGDGGSNLSLAVNNQLAADPDFALEIVGGAGDDRINLSGLQFKNSTTIDGGEGNNTVEVNTTTGAAAAGNTAAENSWASFENVQNLVVAGSNNTTQNLVVGNMEGLEEVVVATGNVNTTLQQMSMDQDLTISGKNQTTGAGNSNNDQNIGTISVQGTSAVSGVDSFGVTLDNTARADGDLTVSALNVADLGTIQSAIRTLDLTSDGRRDTTNLVQSAALSGVNTVNLDGSQDLGLHISAMQVNAQGNSTPSTVDGSELGGDLDLAMNADILNGATDVLTGTEGESDRLYVYGTDAEATVSDFETVDLGLGGVGMPNFAGASTATFSGEFNAAAVSDVEQYNVQATGGATSLINLSGSEVINVNAIGANNDLTLVASDRSSSNEIDVNFSMAAAGWADGTNTLSVQDYRTVNVDLALGDYEFVLDLETDGSDTYARTLNITGGTDDAADTSLDIGALDTALTRVDLSDYTGSLVDGEWADTAGSNARIVMNEFDFTFDVGGDIAGAVGDESEFITTFVVSRDAVDGAVWTIDNFQAFDDTNVDVTTNNVSIIDFSALGFTGLSDINTEQQGVDTVITANDDGFNFEIVLNGVNESELNNENFQFA